MQLTLCFLLVCVLLLLFVQDWRNRQIHVLLPIGIFVLSLFLVPASVSGKLANILSNTAFFLLTVFLMIAYMSVKERKFKNPFENYFGLGDLLFYIAITPLFVLRSYVLYFVISMIFSILLQALLKKQVKANSVPLAGFASLLLVVAIASDLLLQINNLTLLFDAGN
jgi:peptidoglycan/LPS O-acetylase OafA/YrhL